MSAIPYYYNGPMAEGGGRVRLPLFRSRRQHRDRPQAEEAHDRRGRRASPSSRTGARAGDGQHPRGGRDPAAGRVETVKIFVGGLPQAARAAAQLSDRVLARGGARLLHDAVVGASRREAAGGGAVRDRAGGVPAPVGDARSVSHRRRHLDDGVPYEGKIDTMEYKTLRYPGHAPSWRPSASSACWTTTRSR